MRDFLNKIFSKNIVIFILLGALFFGLVKYSDYRFYLLENQLSSFEEKVSSLEKEYNKNIKDISSFILNTQSLQTNITDVLEEEKQKNNQLISQFSEITNTVGALEKLSTTDPELLKKYSKVYFLNEHYVPISLSEIPAEYRYEKSVNYQMHSDVLPFLEKLIDAGNNDGVSFRALSAYRSFITQSNLKAAYKVTYGAGANKFSADQGYSEHQLGTALDLTTAKTNGALEGFDKTPEYKWLLENAHKYGFILSYPKGNTYYIFEPWHWRFVGVELATKIHNENKYFYDEDQRVIDNYLAKLFD